MNKSPNLLVFVAFPLIAGAAFALVSTILSIVEAGYAAEEDGVCGAGDVCVHELEANMETAPVEQGTKETSAESEEISEAEV